MDLLLYPVMVAAILGPTLFFARRHDLLESLSLGAGSSIIAVGAVGLGRFYVILPAARARSVGLLALLVSVVGLAGLCLIARRKSQARTARPQAGLPGELLLALSGTALLCLGVETTLPHFDLAARYYDWFLHYDLAGVYAHGEGLFRKWGEAGLTTRTPLYNLLGAVAFTLFGDRLPVFQVLTAALAWLWLLPFALLARRFLGGRFTPVVALAGLSPLVLQVNTYPWSKGLVAFFALGALERYLSMSEQEWPEAAPSAIQFGLFSAATLMTHPGFVGLPAMLFCLLLYEVVRHRQRIGTLLLSTASGLIVALPWYAWAVAQYGLRLAFLGYPQTPYPSVFRWAIDRVVIVITSFLPVTLPIERFWTDPIGSAFLVYLGTAAGLFGLCFLLRALAQQVRPATRVRRSAAHRAALLYALGGFAIADLLCEGVVSNNGGTFGIPSILALGLLALNSEPMTARSAWLAILEILVVNAAVLLWVFSPAAQNLPNATLAAYHHLRLLGQDLSPIGLALAVCGATACLIAVFRGFNATAERLRERSKAAA